MNNQDPLSSREIVAQAAKANISSPQQRAFFSKEQLALGSFRLTSRKIYVQPALLWTQMDGEQHG
jgi:hypothetical protein